MGVPDIDPNEQQLEAIADVATAAAWAGVSTPLIEGLQARLGGELPNLRTIILIGREAWDNAVKAIVLEGASVTPIAVARLESLRRVARCKLGLCPGDHPESVAEALPWPLGPGGGGGVPTPPPPPLPTPGQSRRIKLSSVLDPTLDADVVPLGRAELHEMHRAYKASRGAPPSQDICPTDDQLSALAQVVASGAPPFADFSIFGRHGKRLAAKLVFTAWIHLPDGGWQRRELPGPSSFSQWWSAWRVLRTSLLLLEKVTPEILDRYGDTFRDLAEEFGEDCWALLYTADTRMRSEEFPRIRRECQLLHEERVAAGLPSSFNPDQPWDSVFAAAVSDNDWWTTNVRNKAVLYLTRLRTANQLLADGTAQPQLQTPGAPSDAQRATPGRDGGGSPAGAPRDRPSRPERQEREDPPKDANGLFLNNRRGAELCDDYFEGKCTRGSACRKSHQCRICLQTHTRAQHGGSGGGRGQKRKRGGGKGR